MFSAIRKHLNPATFMALIALVFAATGGAFAASGGGSPSHSVAQANRSGSGGRGPISSRAYSSKSKPKTKTGPRGPAGKNGAPGPAGATGPGGPVGPAGPTGPAGGTGPAGTGTEGKEGKEGPKGKEGKTGATGEPWTAGGTLPKGSTETGTWAVAGQPYGENPSIIDTAFSFPIQLAAALTETEECGKPGNPACVTHVIEPGEALPAGCTGSLTEPGAASGNLCVFVTEKDASVLSVQVYPNGLAGPQGAGKTGAVIALAQFATGSMYASGTWAVTG